MAAANSSKTDRRPRVGVTWRSAAEEKSGRRRRFDDYLSAVRDAGGEPVEVSLLLALDDLQRLAESLDAVVLSGSAADVDPRRYGRTCGAHTAVADRRRESTDDHLLSHALAAAKPVLAICYGIQSLNVHLHGSLIQDIPTECRTHIDHDREEVGPDVRHPVRIAGGNLLQLAGQSDGAATVRVNSSHHQAILQPGRGLRVTARAPDGVIEAVEWEGGPGWVVGVQWHPERMRGDALSDALFRRLVSEAREASR